MYGMSNSRKKWTGKRIRRIRGEESRIDFAERCGASVHTVQSWEQGRRAPSGAARRKLEDLEEEKI